MSLKKIFSYERFYFIYFDVRLHFWGNVYALLSVFGRDGGSPRVFDCYVHFLSSLEWGEFLNSRKNFIRGIISPLFFVVKRF